MVGENGIYCGATLAALKRRATGGGTAAQVGGDGLGAGAEDFSDDGLGGVVAVTGTSVEDVAVLAALAPSLLGAGGAEGGDLECSSGIGGVQNSGEASESGSTCGSVREGIDARAGANGAGDGQAVGAGGDDGTADGMRTARVDGASAGAGAAGQGAGANAETAPAGARRAGTDGRVAGPDERRAGAEGRAAGPDGQRVGADGQPAGAGGQRAGVDEQLTRADSGDDAWFAWFPFAQTRRPARGDGSSEPETAGVQTAALATDRTSIQVQILPPLEQVLTIIGAMLPSTGGPGALALAAGLVGLGGAGIWLRRTGSRRQRGEP